MKNKKLKIAIFDPARLVPGGGQKVIPKIAEHLSKKHDITLFMQSPPVYSFGDAKLKIIKPTNRFLAPLAFLKVNLKKSDFDIMILGCSANLVVLRNSHIPSIHISHTPPRFFYDLKEKMIKNASFRGKIMIYLKKIFLKRLDYLAARKCTKILAISKEVQKRIRKYYGRASELFYVGVNHSKFKTGRYDNYILSVGRLVWTKRPKMIIEAMKFVKNKKVKLIMVGAGDMEKEIERISKTNKNIEFKKYVSDEELKELYANCLVAISIPINEDMGYVPMEAGFSGKATIGVNEGGLKETIIDGKTGFLIDNITPKKLAEKINLFANNPKLAMKMGEEARKRVKEFDWENVLHKLDKIILVVIKNKKGFYSR